jgi:hypothetical protein
MLISKGDVETVNSIFGRSCFDDCYLWIRGEVLGLFTVPQVDTISDAAIAGDYRWLSVFHVEKN